MKLSEAIQLGSTLKPQAFGEFSDEKGESTCAMGAALDALGQLKKIEGPRKARAERIWPWLKWVFNVTECPWCHQRNRFGSVFNLVVHLNDEDKLSRPQIAYLIFQIELRAICHIDKLVPEYRQLRMTELEANLKQPSKKKKPVPYEAPEKREYGVFVEK